MVVTVKRAGSVACLSFSVERHEKLESSVGNVYDGLGECRVKLQLYESSVTELYSELVTGLIFTVEMLVYFISVGLELNVAVFTNQLSVKYVDHPFSVIY